jgi:nitrite reductase/ring-hydroxylating ferredoxin subunit
VTRHFATHLSSLPPGESAVVDIDGVEILLARVGDNLYAVNNLCSHAEGWLDMGSVYPVTCEVGCPLHEGRFDLRTGRATHEPAVDPIATYGVEISGDDVFIVIGAESHVNASPQ